MGDAKEGREARVSIGNHVLSRAQSMALRVAVGHFLFDLSRPDYVSDLGPIAQGYRARLREVEDLLVDAATDGPNV